MENKKKTIFITGAAGYVGAMLCDQFSKRDDILKIIALDKENLPDILLGNEKIIYFRKNTVDNWEDEVLKYKPTVVIHTAWQIREMFCKKKLQWLWNIDGTNKVFDFAFKNDFVERLIHFSTVASYSAMPDNTREHRFTEDEPFRKSDYLYAEEKRIAEENLIEKYKNSGHKPKVFVIRPAAITGPRGRFDRVRFGLQASLSGQLKKSESIWHKLVSALVHFVPITEKWTRQFIHEDDINDIVELLTSREVKEDFEIFNACPAGPIVKGEDMAKAVGKKAIKIPPWFIRIGFFLAWNLSMGAIPTSRGGWKSYSYPIVVDGSKITRMYGYQYRMNSLDAFTKNEGRYKV